MENITVLSTSLVQATNNRETPERIELTQCDIKLLLVGAIQKGLLFQKPKPSDNKKLYRTPLIQQLKTSLSRTLDFFTPLAGRLATVEHGDDNTISYFIDCNNAGAQFVHAVADGVTIADILKPVYVPAIVRSFFALNGVLSYQGVSKPLLGVQVTELVDGIFVGCTMNHSVVDGTSFWNFFNSWSDISRGYEISKLPVLERWSFLNGDICPPIRIPISSIKRELEWDAASVLQPLKERVFHFSKEKIEELKAKANAGAGADNISSLQSLLAHLWRSVTRNREVDAEEEISFCILVGLRPRLLQQLPEGYFGNLVVVGRVTLAAREILGRGLGYVALQINKCVSWHTQENVKSIADSWMENPGPVIPSSFVSNHGLATSSSPRFNIYGTDFGWGRPVAVRSGPGNKSDGKITLFPGAEVGSVDIEACLLAETLCAMGNDSEFMDAVTV